MSITAKELAKLLNLTPAAVSLALNDKPGVSDATRQKVKDAAVSHGYDFSRIKMKSERNGFVYVIIYKKDGAIVDETPFFSELIQGVSKGCKQIGHKEKIIYLYEEDVTSENLYNLFHKDCFGIILLGTEITASPLQKFLDLKIPLVLLDNYIEELPCDCVLINNMQGSYIATKHLIKTTKKHPGYLKSSYAINNFNGRELGFKKALIQSGYSVSATNIVPLTPSIDGAFLDFDTYLNNGGNVLPCYFADNDLIAVGVIKALQKHGYHVPEDVKIVGFDNLSISQIFSPTLTTIHVPKIDMGFEAVMRLHGRTQTPGISFTKTELCTELIGRDSC
ncbi:MAG: LacI family DNA-binding transcriptional regulator [Lachnospiraceae bacterium]|nr:LacI family DNA-binding transcriptional regulator [Lachnospiraceae bacterium]